MLLLTLQKAREYQRKQQRFADWTRDYGAILHHAVHGFAVGDDRDLLQEVLLVWKSIPAFRGQAEPTTYLYRVCHNAALLWIRSEKNYRRRQTQSHQISTHPNMKGNEHEFR